MQDMNFEDKTSEKRSQYDRNEVTERDVCFEKGHLDV